VVQFAVEQLPPPVMPRNDGPAQQSFATHPSINRIGIPNFGVETITIFPNVCLQPLGGGYLWMEFWPLAPDRTRVEVRMHTDTAPANLREEFAALYGAVAARDVLSEDFALTELQQRGLAMAAKTHQNFGNNEPLLRHFRRAVDHYLYGAEPLPAFLTAKI
jgi:phenylpropionate dioxygenase-like ring-hydroxylating dioxygenase large terminal subunit